MVRASTATATVCELVETAADLYGTLLAEHLGIPASGPLTTVLGDEISARLRKDPLPAPSLRPQNPPGP
ncbi:hypothetical protein [Nonomuraea sp. NPDC050643]|uniref:hypothetical protein n=1 Tax=Nonomuraea sp. NPDC050643 TaxID=3155660 RepID=UPI0033EB8A97